MKPRASRRSELREESGFALSRCERLGWRYVNNRRADAKMHVLLAQDITFSGKMGGDLEKDIESLWIPVQKLKEMIAQGEIENSALLAA